MPNKKYTEEELTEALKSIQRGSMTIYKASKIFNVPKQTLNDKIKKKYTKQSSAGAPTVLNKNEEDLIVRWVKHLGEIGFPITNDQMLHSISKLVKELKRPNNFKNDLPGRHWYEGFLKRNPSISQRVSQTLTMARVGANEEKIRAWFTRVHNYLQDKDLLEILTDPSRIFNCDESAFFLCPKGQGVLVNKGAKTIYCTSNNNEKECLTLSLGASANGILMPIFALFPYKRIPASILAKYPRTWALGRSDSGWMTCQTFYEYITNCFNPFLIKNNIKKPVILFMDGHSSHLSLPLSEFCKDNEIILTALLPNSTHILQPMDVAVFHSLKISWKKQVHEWRMSNNGCRLKREDFAPLLEKCISTTLKSEIIINGFRTCGLYPFNPNAPNYERLPKSAIETNNTSNSNIAASITPSSSNKDSEKFLELFEERLGYDKLQQFKLCDGKWIGDVKDENLYGFWKKANDNVYEIESIAKNNFELGDSTLVANDETEVCTDAMLDWSLLNDGEVMEFDVQVDGTLVSSTPKDGKYLDTEKGPSITPSINVTPQEDSVKLQFPSPFKKCLSWPETPNHSDKKKTVKRKLIPTVAIAEEYMEYQKRVDQEKKAKLEKAEMKNQQKKQKEEERQENQRKPYKKEIKIKNDDKRREKKIKSSVTSSITTAIRPGDHVIIIYEGEKFPGIVTNVLNDNLNYEVKTMAMCGANWRWPDVDDILVYDSKDILKKIYPPVLLNNRGVYSIKDFN